MVPVGGWDCGNDMGATHAQTRTHARTMHSWHEQPDDSEPRWWYGESPDQVHNAFANTIVMHKNWKGYDNFVGQKLLKINKWSKTVANRRMTFFFCLFSCALWTLKKFGMWFGGVEGCIAVHTSHQERSPVTYTHPYWAQKNLSSWPFLDWKPRKTRFLVWNVYNDNTLRSC